MQVKEKILALALTLFTLFSSVAVAQQDIQVTASVSPYLTVTFSYTAVDFGTHNANVTNTPPLLNQTAGVFNVSIDTNKNYTVYGRGTDFSDGAGHTFSISNLKMQSTIDSWTGADFEAVALSGTDQIIPHEEGETTPFTPDVTMNYHKYWLSIPAGQYAASYSSTVTVTYESV
jgi:hypothetical protein